MSDSHGHGHHDVASHVKVYLFVFVALLVGTVVTVAASYLDLGTAVINIALALFIASVKAFLVAGYFMHLMSERKMIYSIMAATVFFFIGLMGLTVWAYYDFPAILAK